MPQRCRCRCCGALASNTRSHTHTQLTAAFTFHPVCLASSSSSSVVVVLVAVPSCKLMATWQRGDRARIFCSVLMSLGYWCSAGRLDTQRRRRHTIQIQIIAFCLVPRSRRGLWRIVCERATGAFTFTCKPFILSTLCDCAARRADGSARHTRRAGDDRPSV